MEWSQQTIKHQIGADQQFGFHEFVPGGSNQPIERLGELTEEFEDISKPTPSGLCLLPAQIKEQCATADRSPTDQKSEDVMDDEAKSSVLEGSAGEDFDPLTVDTMVGLNNHSAGSFNECGICGPAKAIWVPETSETGEPLVEQISEHGQNIKIDPLDTFWIQCDCCEKWFHGNCVGVEEYEDVLIDKFHCAPCAQTNGPTIMKNILLRHRFAFDDATQSELPPEVGTEVWIKKFVETEASIPPPNENHAIVCRNGFEFMDHFNRREDWKKIYLIEEARGLELRVPDKDENFSLRSINSGRSFKVDTIDVYRQVTHSMSIGAFYDKMISKDRPRLYNILSLEFSQNETMRKMVSPPILVPELSFVHKLWPDKNDLINWDPELDYLPSSMKVRQIVEVLEEHRRNKPEVALFCLCGMGGSYTDFHIDFGGSSVWYHIYEGQKVFYIVEPTDEFLDLFEHYQRSDNKTEVFFGDLLPKGALRRVFINAGQTLMIPSGWIHAVYTPVDSLVFGGNFLHALNVPMQLKVYEMEQRLKREVGWEEKFLFPHFELVNWYAARSFVLEHLREANDEGNRADKYMLDAARALLPRLREWMRRDKEDKANFTHSSFHDVLAKLQKEINRQERMRRSLSPLSRSPRKKPKKRKSEDTEPPSPAEVNRGFSSSSSVLPCSSRIEPVSASSVPVEKVHEKKPSAPAGNESTSELDTDLVADFRLKLTKKGKSMFARRSHSGRKPRPSAWLAAAIGLDELEKTSKQLEEVGDQLPLREVVSYEAEMERACEEEEAELLREMNKKKGKEKSTPAAGIFLCIQLSLP
ncbi:JmjC domain protein, partial [Ostertagia ostertagi]